MISYTKEPFKPWSNIIKIRRLRWIGHMLRVPKNAPLKLALKEACSHNKGYKRNNKITRIKTINKDLKLKNKEYSIESVDEGRLANDRE